MDLLNRILAHQTPVYCQWHAVRLSESRWSRYKDSAHAQPTNFNLPRRFHGVEGIPRDYRILCQALNLESKEVGLQTSDGSDVGAVLFDMDGVLCNSEELSRK